MGLGSNLCRRGDGLLFRRRAPRRAERFFRSRFLSLPLQTRLELELAFPRCQATWKTGPLTP
jgi:hypothetical protein